MSLYKHTTKAENKQKRQKEKNSNSMKRLRAKDARHAERRSALGRQTEDRVERLLQKKLTAGELASFDRSTPNSLGDSQGKDFQVTRIQGEKITVSFGITISLRCYQEHEAKHPNVPCIIIPPEMNEENIWRRICKILEEAKARA